MLELLKFAKKYPVTDGGSRPIIDVCQVTYFSPSSTARSASSSQAYHSSTLVQARGPNRFQSVSTSTDRPPIQFQNGPAACSPGSNTSPQVKAGRKSNYSCNSPAQSRFENPNGPSASLPGSVIPSAKAGRSTQFLGNSPDRPPIQSKNGPATCSPGSNTSPQAICEFGLNTRIQTSIELQFLPVIVNHATTGHKLQGKTVESLVIAEWLRVKSWNYDVLSRAKRLSGPFLMEPIPEDIDSLAASNYLEDGRFKEDNSSNP
jgi:hypothetical protein